jgi:phage/plasmid-like protein (TIGR03299 family)
MSHNIAQINGRVSMAYNGQAPWHNLGVRLPNETSIEVALNSANLNWSVKTEDVYLSDGRKAPAQAVTRDIDRAILGVVGERYEVIQNREAFEPLQIALSEFGATVESAGALGQGEKVWMLCKLPDTNGHVAPGDRIQPYFLVATAHDGSSACTARSTPIRVVCQNTLTAALRADRAALSIRHTQSKDQKLDEISKLVEKMAAAHHRTVDTFAQMAQTKVTLDEVINYTEAIWPVVKPKAEKKTDAQLIVTDLLGRQTGTDADRVSKAEEARTVVLHLLQNGKGSELVPMTAWTAYNAVTEYVDHVSVNRRDGTPRTNGARSALFGSGADVKVRALDLALDQWIGSSRN